MLGVALFVQTLDGQRAVREVVGEPRVADLVSYPAIGDPLRLSGCGCSGCDRSAEGFEVVGPPALVEERFGGVVRPQNGGTVLVLDELVERADGGERPAVVET